ATDAGFLSGPPGAPATASRSRESWRARGSRSASTESPWTSRATRGRAGACATARCANGSASPRRHRARDRRSCATRWSAPRCRRPPSWCGSGSRSPDGAHDDLTSAGGAVETAHRDAAAPIEVEQRRLGIAEGVDTIVGPCEYPCDPAGRGEPRLRHVAHGLGDQEEAPSRLPQAWKQGVGDVVELIEACLHNDRAGPGQGATRAHIEGAHVDAAPAGAPQHGGGLLEAEIRSGQAAAGETVVESEIATAELQDTARLPKVVGDEVGDERVARTVVRPGADAHREPVEDGEPVNGRHD